MFGLTTLLTGLLTASCTFAGPTGDRPSCAPYVIISTRGTTEPQGPSVGFVTMINSTLAKLPGGITYDTVYPAAWDQNSTAATIDMIRRVREGLSSCPKQKFALLGYSQGSAATVNALKQISPTCKEGKAIKAVWLIGSPQHLPNKRANIDEIGGSSTNNATGISAWVEGAGIPETWDRSDKVRDCCYFGDEVCSGFTINEPHLLYGSSASVQRIGGEFLVKKLGRGK